VNALVIALVVLVCLLGGALLGQELRKLLPEHHFADESKKALEVGTGTVGSIAGLVLGLLVASATGSYNAQRSNVIDLSARVALLDRVLAHYGPGAEPARVALRDTAQEALVEIWPTDQSRRSNITFAVAPKNDPFDRIADLSPNDARQTWIKNAALGIALQLGQMRWEMQEELTKSVSTPLLIVLTFWFTAVFFSLGLFAPRNATTITAITLAALAITGAIFLMMEMFSPFEGFLRIPSTPLQNVIAGLGK
jgi:hypothetical protein